MRISLSDQILENRVDPRSFVRRGKPRWLKMHLPSSRRYFDLKGLIDRHQLHTVCQEAACPNMGECWSAGVATVMILGDTCTRSCGFCNVKTGRLAAVDLDEPRRAAEAIALMNLDYVVITSVNRDELPDGGAEVWAETIRHTRDATPRTQIEVLIPDFCGDWDALQRVLDARPDVLAHNIETVRRLHPAVRPQAKYRRSIELLRRAKAQGFTVKTGFMAGIGETDQEVAELLADIASLRDGEAPLEQDGTKIDIVSIGQYLQPSPRHLPVARFVHPETFAEYKRIGESLGIGHVEAGPMVRSSYRADRQAAAARSGDRN